MVTAPEHIVVGAGVQMLLEILCVLLKGRRTVSFPDGSFVQGSTVFAAHATPCAPGTRMQTLSMYLPPT